jgi:hypothetical protein
MRAFRGQVLSDTALDGPMRIHAGDFLDMRTCLRMWRSVGIAFPG